MSFWRDEVVEFALDHETRLAIDEQKAWIQREPSNPKAYYGLARLYRMCGKTDEARVLFAEALRYDDTFAPAHVALCEMCAIAGEYPAAWRHARQAEAAGDASGVALLKRHGIAE